MAGRANPVTRGGGGHRPRPRYSSQLLTPRNFDELKDYVKSIRSWYSEHAPLEDLPAHESLMRFLDGERYGWIWSLRNGIELTTLVAYTGVEYPLPPAGSDENTRSGPRG